MYGKKGGQHKEKQYHIFISAGTMNYKRGVFSLFSNKQAKQILLYHKKFLQIYSLSPLHGNDLIPSEIEVFSSYSLSRIARYLVLDITYLVYVFTSVLSLLICQTDISIFVSLMQELVT